jgi:hypothetical protein
MSALITEEHRREARRQIIHDYDGVPEGWSVERLKALETSYANRIAAEEQQ